MKLKTIIIALLLFSLLSANAYAATLPGSIKESWKSQKESILANVEATEMDIKELNFQKSTNYTIQRESCFIHTNPLLLSKVFRFKMALFIY